MGKRIYSYTIDLTIDCSLSGLEKNGLQLRLENVVTEVLSRELLSGNVNIHDPQYPEYIFCPNCREPINSRDIKEKSLRKCPYCSNWEI